MTDKETDLLDLGNLSLRDLKDVDQSALDHALRRFLLEQETPAVAAFESYIDRWP